MLTWEVRLKMFCWLECSCWYSFWIIQFENQCRRAASNLFLRLFTSSSFPCARSSVRGRDARSGQCVQVLRGVRSCLRSSPALVVCVVNSYRLFSTIVRRAVDCMFSLCARERKYANNSWKFRPELWNIDAFCGEYSLFESVSSALQTAAATNVTW